MTQQSCLKPEGSTLHYNYAIIAIMYQIYCCLTLIFISRQIGK